MKTILIISYSTTLLFQVSFIFILYNIYQMYAYCTCVVYTMYGIMVLQAIGNSVYYTRAFVWRWELICCILFSYINSNLFGEFRNGLKLFLFEVNHKHKNCLILIPKSEIMLCYVRESILSYKYHLFNYLQDRFIWAPRNLQIKTN